MYSGDLPLLLNIYLFLFPEFQQSWVCDGQNDCGDNSDEENCDGSKIQKCPDDHMMCAKSRLCVSNVWICDEDMDCPDGEDEANCPPPLIETSPSITHNKSHCAKDEFQCKERHFCIHSAWLCDGDKDCPDGTDEVDRLFLKQKS